MKKIIISLFLLILMSCSKGPESQKAFENIMSAFQSGDPKQITKISNEDLSNNPFDESFFEQAPFYLEHFKKIKYKIIEVKEEKDTSTIKFSIEAPDLFEYAPEVFQKLLGLAFSGSSEEMIYKSMNSDYSEILKKSDLKYINKELTLNMIKKDGKWIIDKNSPDIEKFASILIGGLDKVNNDGSASTENEKVETKFFKKGERGVISKTAQTVTDVTIIEKPDFHKLNDGNELLVIKLTKENISDDVVTAVSPEQYQIETKDGMLIKPTFGTGHDKYNYDDLPVGNKIEQILSFEVPKGQASKLLIIVDGQKIVNYDLGL